MDLLLRGGFMPILGEEPSIYPETLLDENVTCAPDSRWWVLYTRARQEKAISRDLLNFQIPFYLPLIKKTSVRQGRKKTSYVPLFSGYVFLQATEQQRIASLTTNRISRIIPVDDAGQLLHDLRQLRQLIASNIPLTIESRLEAGDRVRVRQGPLMGMEGTVLTRRHATRLLVSVNFLQQGASVEIDDYLLEVLD
jgi:transcription antitermination factor NusG